MWPALVALASVNAEVVTSGLGVSAIEVLTAATCPAVCLVITASFSEATVTCLPSSAICDFIAAICADIASWALSTAVSTAASAAAMIASTSAS